MTHLIEEVEVNENEFHILVDGDRKFICEREHTTRNGMKARGFWILKMQTLAGMLQVDRDQYSNDLRERVSIHVNEKPVYGNQFKIECSLEHFRTNCSDWCLDFKYQFGGEWIGEFYDWEGKAVLEKVKGS